MGLCHEVGAHCKYFIIIGNNPTLRVPFHWPSNPIILSRHLLSLSRHYATSDSPGVQKRPTRKQVTIRNDDGRVEWNELTIGEKAARTTQQTFNFGVVLAGLAGTVCITARMDFQQLTWNRLLLATSYIQRCSPPTARPESSIEPSTVSGLTLKHSSYSALAKRSELLGSRRLIGGAGIGRLRKRE